MRVPFKVFEVQELHDVAMMAISTSYTIGLRGGVPREGCAKRPKVVSEYTVRSGTGEWVVRTRVFRYLDPEKSKNFCIRMDESGLSVWCEIEENGRRREVGTRWIDAVLRTVRYMLEVDDVDVFNSTAELLGVESGELC